MTRQTHILSGLLFAAISLMPVALFAQEVNITTFNAGDIISADEVNANFTALQAAIQQLREEVAALKQENQQLRNALNEMQASPAATRQTPTIQLRSQPLTVSDDEAVKTFKLTESSKRPTVYIENQFELQGDVVIDHATDLMWQQSGSQYDMNYEYAQAYIKNLNRQKFAGYSDWRLPTIDELLSLLEPEKQRHGLYINPVFDHQAQFWSGDHCTSESSWMIITVTGSVTWSDHRTKRDVRAVRSQ